MPVPHDDMPAEENWVNPFNPPTPGPDPCEAEPKEKVVGYVFRANQSGGDPIYIQSIHTALATEAYGGPGYTFDVEDAQTYPDVASALSQLQHAVMGEGWVDSSMELVRVTERTIVERTVEVVE